MYICIGLCIYIYRPIPIFHVTTARYHVIKRQLSENNCNNDNNNNSNSSSSGGGCSSSRVVPS